MICNFLTEHLNKIKKSKKENLERIENIVLQKLAII